MTPEEFEKLSNKWLLRCFVASMSLTFGVLLGVKIIHYLANLYYGG